MNIGDVLRYGDEMVVRAVEGLPDAAWLTPGVCGAWSVKDVIAHLGDTELLILDAVASLVQAGPTPKIEAYRSQDPAVNDREVERRRSWDPARTLAEYRDVARRVGELASRVPPETGRRPGTLPWYGEEYALDDFVAYVGYGHKAEHCAQIAVYRDRLNASAAS
jgi:uncharacterized protein (TIGR03083 family)